MLYHIDFYWIFQINVKLFSLTNSTYFLVHFYSSTFFTAYFDDFVHLPTILLFKKECLSLDWISVEICKCITKFCLKREYTYVLIWKYQLPGMKYFFDKDTSIIHDLVLKILCKNENISHLKLNIHVLSFVKVQLNSKQKTKSIFLYMYFNANVNIS